MTTVVKAERHKLQQQYAQLRAKVLEHYRAMSLVAEAPSAPPPKLGYWKAQHSEALRGAYPELRPLADRIDDLKRRHDPKTIKAAHVYLRRGDNFRRRDPNAPPREQLNPGETPAIYKKY